MNEKFSIPSQPDDSEKKSTGSIAGKRGEGFAEVFNDDQEDSSEKLLLMQTEEVRERLREIQEKYGIDPKSLVRLLARSDINRAAREEGTQMSKNARRRLKRYLKGSDETFEMLAEIIRINKELAEDKNGEGYTNFIKSNLSQTDFNQYLHGEWTAEILRIVSIAQKKFGFGERAAVSPSEAQPRAKFAPSSAYKRYFNR